MTRWYHPHPLISAALVIVGPVSAEAAVYLSVGDAQQAIFPGESFERLEVELSEAQAAAVRKASGMRVRERELHLWRASGGGFFFVDRVLGKHEFITYALGVDASGRVKGVEILEYRESYGHEIRNEAWRRQFKGKDSEAPLTLDQDIRNISGATLSCRHVTDGVKRLLDTHAILFGPPA